MDELLHEMAHFKQDHPFIVRAMEIFQISMEEYERACRFPHQPRTYTSNTTFLAESDSE